MAHPTDEMTPEQHADYMTKVIAARKLLAAHDPIGEAMEVLAAAGCFRCKLKGQLPGARLGLGDMSFTVEGGAPEPRMLKRKGAQ